MIRFPHLSSCAIQEHAAEAVKALCPTEPDRGTCTGLRSWTRANGSTGVHVKIENPTGCATAPRKSGAAPSPEITAMDGSSCHRTFELVEVRVTTSDKRG